MLRKRIRPGKGKMRNRRYISRKELLIVYGTEGAKLVKAFRNIPGVEICHVDRLNLLKLAPVMMEDEASRIVNVSESAPITESLDSTPEVEQDPMNVKRRAIQPRSSAWPHYDKLIEDGINKATCKYCGKVLLADPIRNGTSGLNKHLKTYPTNPNKVDTSNSKYKY
ncbi:large ribosomal subunit protein uL4z-like [Lycium barbarum]|uniref:large ribosomal subunit protein uL4z-like n=1 Tax=Lycium barbarum TaxID=112863 RepID=UPI00293F2D53|nr:large ribosomal subunit protein uL4z-like [Lycium barbarum]